MIGTSLGPYKIIEQLGAGGMGEVFLGEDTRLGRKVAIKVLPAEFASDPERLARFEQEARAAAALNHPHIAAVFDVGAETTEGSEVPTHFIVQEYLEGQSLRERLDKGALPFGKALDLAIEVGEALIAAHKAGIIHRDLKPDNVFVTEEGHAKVLDFGLAKLMEPSGPPGSELSMSPTMLGTVAGQVMGTAGYMAPEQAAGAPDIDHRADMFAFGCVLYQMVTGKQPFAGRSVAETLAHIQHDEPPVIAESHPTLPAEIQRVIGKCLMKQPGRRYQHADDLIVDLQLLRADVESGSAVPLGGVQLIGETRGPDNRPASAPSGRRRWIPVVTTAVLTGFVVGVALWNLNGTTPATAPVPQRLSVVLPSDTPLEIETWRPGVAISPNGDRILYVGNRDGRTQIFVRRLGLEEIVGVPGSEGGSGPFLSHDGESVGFFVDNEMRTASLSGGAATMLADVPPVTRGASWGPDSIIVLTGDTNGGLSRIPVGGATMPADAFHGAPYLRGSQQQVLTVIDAPGGVFSHRWAEHLPGGEAILYTVDTGGSFDNADIAVLSLARGDSRTLIRGGTNARYSPTGHIVFARGGDLLAVPFDLDTLEVTLPPVTVLDGVMMEPGGAAHFALSDNGTLVYVPGEVLVPNRRLVWVDRNGNAQPLPAAAREYMSPSLSPDGRQVAVTVREGSNYDIWLVDVGRGSLTPMTTHPGEDFGPVWMPTGDMVAFSSEMSPDFPRPTAWWQRADLGEAAEPLTPAGGDLSWGFPSSFSPNGDALLLVASADASSASAIWSLSVAEDRAATIFESAEGYESQAAFSPDGDWVAFVSDRSGQAQVYVKRADGVGGSEAVSVDGGEEPVWSPNGTEIFFRNGNQMLSAAIRSTEASIEPEIPVVLFEARYLPTGLPHIRRNYDVAAPDRFLMIRREADLTPTELKVILNFDEELKQRVPTGR